MKKTEQRTDTDTSQPNMFYDLAFCVVGFTLFFFEAHTSSTIIWSSKWLTDDWTFITHPHANQPNMSTNLICRTDIYLLSAVIRFFLNRVMASKVEEKKSLHK